MNQARVRAAFRAAADLIVDALFDEGDPVTRKVPVKPRTRRAPPVVPLPPPDIDPASRATARAIAKRFGLLVPERE